jgi:Fe2+ transport system protein FeoA
VEVSLDRLCIGQQAVVTHIETDPALRCRLRCFGLVPGTQVCCRYRSPGGSVTALEFRGSVVALRTRDMRKIWGCY